MKIFQIIRKKAKDLPDGKDDVKIYTPEKKPVSKHSGDVVVVPRERYEALVRQEFLMELSLLAKAEAKKEEEKKKCQGK